MSNSLDPDQDRHSVGPDLGPNCLQIEVISRRTKVTASKERVKEVPLNEFSIWSGALNKLGMVLQYFKGHRWKLQITVLIHVDEFVL